MNDSETRLRPLMFAGTGSDVGKSIVATAFCRIFKQDGYTPAPFKAQNMALNSYATPDGLEIGRAQAVQAEAAGVACHTDMNPLLLKPNSDHTSQVVLNGKPIGNQHATQYFRKEGRDFLRAEVHKAFDRLSARFHPIVMEGAGSVAEVNLRDVDLVNMNMAIYADAAVILVADIDRGGVFASIYGTIMLMDEEERKHIKGIIINKFRGDLSLFNDGRRIIEQLCGIPVLGVLPYFKDIHIEEEDSVSLEMKCREAQEGKINVAVVMLRHLSNFTDFDVLERDERVHLFYTNNTEEIKKADIIIIPGSKSTLADLVELRRNGTAQAILRAHHDGATVMGICGGYQIMGQEVCDPHHVESEVERMPGLGLLPTHTTMSGAKRTVQTTFRFLDGEEACHGYEIHMGKTEITGQNARPLCTFAATSSTKESLDNKENLVSEGCFVSEKCFGTYMHGILDNPSIVDFLLAPYIEKVQQRASFNYAAYKEQQYDRLATEVRKRIDMQEIYRLMSI
ncbi:MAG: cobyric acid synthase [Prevotellaceae bacterium]|nr:cobyric acid synthase [Prevotella sp.]MDD7257755.1 cobyric acid synthase [Prevotellaceae bacterium]MDY6130510.1 cobyric acid synthase [Prevotella sp.]